MAKQLLFYEKVAPVSAERHGNLCVESGVPYEFARHARAVPLVAAEIPHAAREYTVVFADAGESITPFVILGIKDDENLYISEEGEWTAKYIPAFVRRYPFVFSSHDDDKTRFTLCIDESWAGCNTEGRGERLFDDEGKRTEFLDRLLKFNENYQVSAQQTTAFCNKLKELDLLDAKEGQLTLADGEKLRLRGFMAVSREKLNALPESTLSELAKNGALELTYAHLLSMNNFVAMSGRMAERKPAATPAEPAV
jgi:hypothetical protein